MEEFGYDVVDEWIISKTNYSGKCRIANEVLFQ